MKRHPAMRRQSRPMVVGHSGELISKMLGQEAFDATPAGAALVKFRRALQTAVASDENEPSPPLGDGGPWGKCRAAETELIAEIKRLQEKEMGDL